MGDEAKKRKSPAKSGRVGISVVVTSELYGMLIFDKLEVLIFIMQYHTTEGIIHSCDS